MYDYEMPNDNNEASNWVNVPSLGRLTYQELESMVDNGEVVEIIDPENKKVKYRKA